MPFNLRRLLIKEIILVRDYIFIVRMYACTKFTEELKKKKKTEGNKQVFTPQWIYWQTMVNKTLSTNKKNFVLDKRKQKKSDHNTTFEVSIFK